MSDNTSEKTKNCLKCKKALIDETVPICLRCRLEERNKVVVGGVVVVGLGGLLKFFNDNAQGDANSDDDSDSDSDDEDD